MWNACEVSCCLTSVGGRYPMGKIPVLLHIQSRIVNPSWCHFFSTRFAYTSKWELGNLGFIIALLLLYSHSLIASQDLIILSHHFFYIQPLLSFNFLPLFKSDGSFSRQQLEGIWSWAVRNHLGGLPHPTIEILSLSIVSE